MKKTPPVSEKVTITPKNLARVKHLAEMMEGTVEEFTNMILSDLLNDVYDDGRLAEIYLYSFSYDTEDEARRIIGRLQAHDAAQGGLRSEVVYPLNDKGRVSPKFAYEVAA